MTLNDFISHIKHNSLQLVVSTAGGKNFLGTVGEFKNAIIKNLIGEFKIIKITPLANSLNILLEA